MEKGIAQLETLLAEICRELFMKLDHESLIALIHASPHCRKMYLSEREGMHSSIAPKQLRIAIFANTITKAPANSPSGYHIVRRAYGSAIARYFRIFSRGQVLDSVTRRVATIADLKKMVQMEEMTKCLTMGFQIWLKEQSKESGVKELACWSNLRAQRAFYTWEIFMILFRGGVLQEENSDNVLNGFIKNHKDSTTPRGSMCTWLGLQDLDVVLKYGRVCYERLLAKIEKYFERYPAKKVLAGGGRTRDDIFYTPRFHNYVLVTGPRLLSDMIKYTENDCDVYPMIEVLRHFKSMERV